MINAYLIFQELESIISEHFGRTPASTPVCSQTLEASDESDVDTSSYADICQGRVRSMVSEFIDASDDNDSDNEDDHIDRRSLSANENHVHNVTSAGVYEQGEDDPDKLAVENFMKECGCSRHCQKNFTPSSVYQSIFDMREKSKDEKEMFLMGILSNCVDTSSSTKRGKKRSRVRTHFTINGASVCRETFQLFFDVKRAVLYALIQTVNQGGCMPRTHGNTGRKPKHALMFDDVNRVVQFIMNTSEEIGLPYPAAPRGKDNIPIVFLPSSTTKLHLHAQYSAACEEQNVRCVKISAFKSMWLHCVPHIRIAKPREDVCGTCERLRRDIVGALQKKRSYMH